MNRIAIILLLSSFSLNASENKLVSQLAEEISHNLTSEERESITRERLEEAIIKSLPYLSSETEVVKSEDWRKLAIQELTSCLKAGLIILPACLNDFSMSKAIYMMIAYFMINGIPEHLVKEKIDEPKALLTKAEKSR